MNHHVEVDPPAGFVRLAEQTGERKVHVIKVPVVFPSSSEVEEQTARCCDAPLRRAFVEYRFSWGKTERLECVVENTPALKCECGSTFVEATIAWPIREKAKAIRQYIEFQDQGPLDTLLGFLSPIDIAKIRDFSETVRSYPWVRDGETKSVGPLKKN